MDTSGGMLSKLFGWIPSWVGYVLIIIAGIVMIVIGATRTPVSVGLIAFGVAAIAAAIIAWYNASSKSSKPDVNPSDLTFGGSLERMDGWAWIAIFLIFVVALVIALVFK